MPVTGEERSQIRFGTFSVDLAARELLNGGVKVRLQGLPFQILVILLERPGEWVTREELQQRLWPPDVFVDFEHSINTAIVKLRRALGDDAVEPRFIETLPRYGYRLIAPLEAGPAPKDSGHLITREEDTDDATASTCIVGVRTPGVGVIFLTRRKLAVATVLLAVCLGAYGMWHPHNSETSAKGVVADVLSWFGYRTTSAAVLTPRDYVLISDFENQTGDPVFDRSLSSALATSLEQTSVANVYSPARVRETLRRMERQNVEHVDEGLALEIAEREGIKVVVLPTITSVGQSYHLAARIRAVSSGRDITTEVSRATGKDHVLEAVDELAAALRKDLGESLQRISESKPLAAATTPSLEALKQYSLGLEKDRAADVQEAKTYYENALAIDPSFTMARASLGVMEMDWAATGVPHFDAEEGKRLLTDAVHHTSNLTDKERYSILASYAEWVENDPDKAIHYYKTLLAIYPDYPEAYNILGRVYSRMGRYDEAITAAKQAILIDPHLLIAYTNLSEVQLYEQGDVKSGMETCQRALHIDPHNAWSYDCVGWASFGRGDWAQAQAAFQEAVLYNPPYTLFRFRLAHAYRLQGHYQQALDTLEPLLRIDPSDPTPWYDMGVVCQEMGDQDQAHQYFQHYQGEMEAQLRRHPNDAETIWDLAILFSRLGDKERASYWTRKGLVLAPNRHFEYAQVLSLNQHKPEAIDELRIALQTEHPSWYPIFIKIHPDLQALHGEPKFEQLLASVIKN